MNTADRFWSKVDKTEGCWNWTAARQSSGYGSFQKWLAHRWSYEQSVGPIPAGLQIDHICRNRLCVNPAHLEPVTAAENNRRGLRDRMGKVDPTPEEIATLRDLFDRFLPSMSDTAQRMKGYVA